MIDAREYFSKWANNPRPSHIWHRCATQLHHPVRTKVREVLEVMEVGSLLDVACGTGTQSEYFSGEYVGVDVTRRFVACAHDYYGVGAVLNASGGSLPFRDGAFDVATCKDLLEHLLPHMWRDVVREMWRVSRMGIIVVFFNLTNSENTTYRIGDLGYYHSIFNWRKDVRPFLQGLGATYAGVVWDVGEPKNQVMVALK